MSEIVWEDPPEQTHGRSVARWERLIRELKAHPGKWALVEECSTAKNARNRASYLRNRHRLDAVARKGSVYARWLEDVS